MPIKLDCFRVTSKNFYNKIKPQNCHLRPVSVSNLIKQKFKNINNMTFYRTEVKNISFYRTEDKLNKKD